MLNKAREICVEKHAGQVDKNGAPYYLHPFAVADMVSGTDEKIVAYLHDVVEDTGTSIEDLAEYGFGAEILDAVEAITRKDGEDYFDYIRRVSRNGIAKAVKKADLRHNLSPERKGATAAMRNRYETALQILDE